MKPKIHFNPYKLERLDSRIDLHRRSQFIFYLQLELHILILDEHICPLPSSPHMDPYQC
ncbi:hypothetical protein IGI04_007433 [Brassica rapa subsp. trilocularis]|uniref:Uncharacterized protein n=1 Tax=Brassica rapa subsp. trilocularis TaxID=1813537 RepID=A0ABQ7NJU5_BRACM|nr:hypothetical protein IGI04_007433 [Brassica rapa subsp. trilocularis]